MTSDSPLIGRTFGAGKYRILALIGEGGMAAVYRAVRVEAPDEAGSRSLESTQKGIGIPPRPAGHGTIPIPVLPIRNESRGGEGTVAPGDAARPSQPAESKGGEPPRSSGPPRPSSEPRSSGERARFTPSPSTQRMPAALRVGDQVAVKIMNAQLARDPTFVKRFQREGKAAARLKHRSVVHIHEWGVEDGLPYIVMELIEGAELVRILDHARRFPEARAARITAQMCSALAAAHDLGIVHRDLKPENVMLLRDAKDPSQERVKVLDFGIAKLVEPEMRPPDALPADSEPEPASSRSALTMVGTLVGTPEYMSPEQSRGIAVDARSDVYACGILLYQMVTGTLPFTGETHFEVAIKHMNEPPTPPSAIVRGLNPKLEALILQALAKAPSDRPQSARVMLEALHDMLPELSETAAQSMAPGPMRPAAGSQPDLRGPVPAAGRRPTPAPDSDQAMTLRMPSLSEPLPPAAARPPAPTPAAGAPAIGKNPLASTMASEGVPATVRMPETAGAAPAAPRAPLPAAGRPQAASEPLFAPAGHPGVAATAPMAALPVTGDAFDTSAPRTRRRGARAASLSTVAALALGVVLGGAIIALVMLVVSLVR
jgi:eukaryotic-like serine/threonine-protein kinase